MSDDDEDLDTNWTLTTPELALFVRYHVSIPPRVEEVARVLERLYWEEIMDWQSVK
jgi:hypothetical protein